LKPKDIQDFNDLRKLPFLTKELIRDNLNDLKATNYPERKFEYVTTSGSTGISLGFYYDKGVTRAKEWAFMKTQWDRVGYRFRDRCIMLKGSVVKAASRGIFHEPTLLGRWLILSSYHMTDDNLPEYVKQIRRFKPRYIQAFPSSASILARYMEKHHIAPFDGIKAILCSSENLYPAQRELLERVFQCRTYSWYGQAENVVLAGECEVSTDYHIFPEYGITELVREDGSPVQNEDESGIIVGTGFNNYAMPLIRYQTDDMGMRVQGNCDCHREYCLLTSVKGKWLQEFIITRNNRPISITALNMHSDVYDNVSQFQFYQDKKEEVVFNVVRKESYTDRDTEYIRRELLKKLGDDINLVINFTDHIPRTKGGKYRFLVQKLSTRFEDWGQG
jgi:phenylacetate-CoA ligase